jgi:hypothetical protein
MKYMEDDVHFMTDKMNKFIKEVTPVLTDDKTLSEKKLQCEKRLEELVKTYTQACGYDSDFKTVMNFAKMELSRMNLDFK